MKKFDTPFSYNQPTGNDILEAYINKNTSYNRADARRIRRALRRLAIA